MKRWFGIGLIVAGLWVGGCRTESGAPAGGIGRPTTVPTTQAMSCDALIDRFVTISTADYGVQTNILDTPGNPTETQEGLLPLGPREVKPSEAMEELVRRGFDSIGPLVRHIDDARPTQFKIVNENMAFMSVTADNEYDYNARTTAEPAGVNLGWNRLRRQTKTSPEQIESHALTVGDVCFKVLGQIVGRQYDPIRYQPTACLVINSPTHAPALAKAVRDEWGSLTREQHKGKLVQDLLQPDTLERERLAIKVLARYYPKAAEDPVIKRLQLPLFDEKVVCDLCEKIEKLGAQQKREACEQFIKERGPMYRDALLKVIVEVHGYWSIADAFPEIDLRKGYYADLNFFHELYMLIDCLTENELHTPRLDAYLYGLYQRAGKDPALGDGIATSCIDYLVGRGHDAEFLTYCRDHLESTISNKERMENAIKKVEAARLGEELPLEPTVESVSVISLQGYRSYTAPWVDSYVAKYGRLGWLVGLCDYESAWPDEMRAGASENNPLDDRVKDVFYTRFLASKEGQGLPPMPDRMDESRRDKMIRHAIVVLLRGAPPATRP